MSILRNEKGLSTIKLWIWLVLVILVVYVGTKLLPMYIDFERMKDEMSVKASLAQILKDDEIRSALAAKAKELELPLDRDDFIILRDDEHHHMTIKTDWDIEVHFPFDIYVRNFHFAAVASEDTSRVRM
jgi:hypothetical protein